MANHLGIKAPVARRLLATCVLSAQMGRFEQAAVIARAVVRFRPDLPQPRAVLGAAQLGLKRYQDAIAELRDAIKIFPDSQMTKAMLGMAYAKVGRPEGIELLQQVIDDQRDEWAIAYATQALSLLQHTSPDGSLPHTRTRPLGLRSILG